MEERNGEKLKGEKGKQCGSVFDMFSNDEIKELQERIDKETVAENMDTTTNNTVEMNSITSTKTVTHNVTGITPTINAIVEEFKKQRNKRKIIRAEEKVSKNAKVDRDNETNHNRFANLIDFAEMDGIEELTQQEDAATTSSTINNKDRLNLNNNNNHNINDNLNNKNLDFDRNKKQKEKQKENRFCPAIYVFGINAKLIERLILEKDKNVKYRFVNLGFRRVKVSVNDIKIHKYIIDTLRETKADAYSFTPKEERKVSLLLKGVDGETDPSDISKEIKELYPNLRIAKIKPFTTMRSRELNIPLNIFIVQLESGQNDTELIRIRYILNQRVHWEKIYRSTIKRCFRCQRFGHNAEYCAFETKCMICSEGHSYLECPSNKKNLNNSEKNITLKCSNCNMVGHSANAKDCPTFLNYKYKKEKLLENKKILQDNRKKIVANQINSQVRTGLSYANIVKNQSVNLEHPSYDNGNNSNNNNFFSEFMNEAVNLFDMSLTQLILKIKEFWPYYKSLNSKEKKLEAYLSFITTLTNKDGTY